ncbi:MAG: hypothetical protein JNM09_06560 [Blastocatellia bacterium]|nr:hypothetical protein [Blastocatellia bacterium]
MQNRKQTAWRKNRKLGDIQGGRKRVKREDNIFQRKHSLQRPAPDAELPILLEENPSKGFVFPVSGQEVLVHLRAYPSEAIEGITHIWLRRAKKAEFEAGALPLAEFICGSGVRVIVLYPWAKDLTLSFGTMKPSAKELRQYAHWTEDLVCKRSQWYLRWQPEALKSFYLDHLLAHEIGHHVDWYARHWSKANRKQVEEFAEQYAWQWLATATKTYHVTE